MNHPKAKQIRLPFSVPKPGRSQSQARLCGICRKRDSRYTCPRCNVAYCSLDCFQSQVHSQCSEPFYRSTVLDSIATDPKAGMEEKKRMMEMLRRFEQAAAEGDDLAEELDEDEDEEEEEELRKQLEGIDLEEIDSNALFHLLPPKHRDKFLEALRNPDSEDAKQLLTTAAGEKREAAPPGPLVLPWWEASLGEDDGDALEIYAEAPELISEDILIGIKPPEGTGEKLIYNAIAMCLAYLHTLLSLRLPSLSTTHPSAQRVTSEELQSDLLTLLPFLSDLKSTTRYESARAAYSAIWESIGTTLDTPPETSTLIRLVAQLPSLLHPPIVASESPKLLLVLSDMYDLFSRPKPGAGVPRKLGFYVVALRGLRRDDWLRVEKEVRKEIGMLEDQGGGQDDEDQVEEDRPGLRIVSSI